MILYGMIRREGRWPDHWNVFFERPERHLGGLLLRGGARRGILSSQTGEEASMMTTYNREAVNKALPMVREAEYQLVRAQDKLDSARSWGIWDILGGGIISTLV